MKIFNGTTEFLDEDTAYSKIMKYLGVTSGTQLLAQAVQARYTPSGGGQTYEDNILAISTSARNKYVMLTCTYADGFDAGGGHGQRIEATPVSPEELVNTLTSVIVPNLGKPASGWELIIGTQVSQTKIEIDTSILGITLDWKD